MWLKGHKKAEIIKETDRYLQLPKIHRFHAGNLRSQQMEAMHTEIIIRKKYKYYEHFILCDTCLT